ncbi:MAG: coproporphyrinogen III oxidase [Rhodobiaceae bacterium]|nr:MAG: coproporphyrinogen III oxidase [Rhodobiaceae bacterium]
MPSSRPERTHPTGPGTAPGFGVYVHWPFCQAKCPYCDFNSHVVRGVDQARYAAALVCELEYMSEACDPQLLTSVFFGGGTPSLMEPKTVETILSAIDRLWGLNQGVEISLEANPTSVEADNFKAYATLGINRVSLGVQAMNDKDLKFLGRLHTADEALKAIDLARTHFPRLSFDLIYARPGQTVEAWQAELTRAIDFAVDHLSLYQLTIEEGTPFFDLHARGSFAIPQEEEAAALYEATQSLCADAGLAAYEVSNHAKAGAECRHNLTYWRYGDYVGVGPGAHGRLGGRAGARATKRATVSEHMPTKWLALVEAQGHGLIEQETISAENASEEMLLMGLRLSEGISLSRFEEISSRKIDPDRLTFFAKKNLVTVTGDRLVATASGRLVLNRLLSEILA